METGKSKFDDQISIFLNIWFLGLKQKKKFDNFIVLNI